MHGASVAPKLGFRFMLTIKRGPDKGATFQLLPPRVTLGRGPDNNVILKDPRVSRNAAVIEFSMEKIVITDVSSRQTMTVNGQLAQETSLKDGDLIGLGDTELHFAVEALPLAPNMPPAPTQMAQQPQGNMMPFPNPQAPTAPAMNPGAFDTAPPNYSSPGQAQSKGGQDNSQRFRFYMIIGVAALALVWLLTSKKKDKPVEQGLKTVEEIQAELESSEVRRQELQTKRQFRSEAERTRYEEAQAHYLAGFRDYQKGQFSRAIRSFETALAIDSSHALASRYKRLAEKQRDEMIAMLTLEGRRYKEKNMYSRCSAAFEKVLDALTNKDDLKYKQAEALKKECDLLLEQRFK